jgi:exodeoxyribonuclease-1
MLFRYRARNFPDSLSAQERQRWEGFRRSRLDAARWQDFARSMKEAAGLCKSPQDEDILAELSTYAEQVKPPPEQA